MEKGLNVDLYAQLLEGEVLRQRHEIAQLKVKVKSLGHMIEVLEAQGKSVKKTRKGATLEKVMDDITDTDQDMAEGKLSHDQEMEVPFE